MGRRSGRRDPKQRERAERPKASLRKRLKDLARGLLVALVGVLRRRQRH